MRFQSSRNRGLKTAVLFILLIIPCLSLSQDYIWPTNSSRLLSSTFGEFREGRFHVGIDISTWGRTGYRVFAVESGYVWKILISPFGYGRAIYLKLNDGRIALYGHLKKFVPKIEEPAREEQKKKNSFRIVKYFRKNQIPVKKGELIAYTGASGSGPPHLHFELREEEAVPVNPLKFDFDFIDDTPPIIRKISLTPLSDNSFVEGDFLPKVIDVKHVKMGQYKIEPELKIYGKIGFAISTFDHNGKNANKFSPYSVTLEIDNALVFEVKYDKLSYFKNSRIYIDRDYYLLREGMGYFHKLYKDYGNDLDIYNVRDEYGGVISAVSLKENGIGKGTHDFKITVTDFKRNSSIVTGMLNVFPNDNMLPSNTNNFNTTASNNSLPVNFNVEMKSFNDFLRLEISGPFDNKKYPKVYINNSIGNIPLYLISPDKIAARINFRDNLENLDIKIEHNDNIVWKTSQKFKKIGLNGGRIISEDGLFTAEIGKGAVYSPFWAKVDIVENLYPVNENLRRSSIYKINPSTVPLKNEAAVKIKYNTNEINTSKLGVFSFNSEKEDWNFVSQEIDSLNGLVTGRINKFGELALLIDDRPPDIYRFSPRDGQKIFNRKPLIRASVKDDLSGIGSNCQTDIYLDGKKLIAEYDPEAEILFYRVEESLGFGNHTVEFIVEDNIGNSAVRKLTFEVKSR
ncbi:M23 family metallopeptidase [candidate division KSB1 bacterium]